MTFNFSQFAKSIREHTSELQELQCEMRRLALTTQRADRERLEWAIKEIYGVAGHAPPEQFIWLSSPLYAAITMGLWHFNQYPEVPGERSIGLHQLPRFANDTVSRRHFEYWENQGFDPYTDWYWRRDTVGSQRMNCIDSFLLLDLTELVPWIDSERVSVPDRVFMKTPTIRELFDMVRIENSEAVISGNYRTVGNVIFSSELRAICRQINGALEEDLSALDWKKHSAGSDTPLYEMRNRLLNVIEHCSKLLEGFLEGEPDSWFRCLPKEDLSHILWSNSPWRLLARSPIGDAYSMAIRKGLSIVTGEEVPPNTRPYEEALKAGGWWWPTKRLCFLCDNPVDLQTDSQLRLHSETSMAVRFGDGWGCWTLNGVRVPEKVVLGPFTAADISEQRNSEVRTVMINRFGRTRWLVEHGGKEIHRDDFGILYQVNGASSGRNRDRFTHVVRVTNRTAEPDGSFKDYYLAVPPQIRRAREAVAWTFGMSEADYKPAKET